MSIKRQSLIIAIMIVNQYAVVILSINKTMIVVVIVVIIVIDVQAVAVIARIAIVIVV